jgi:hypothetical protein
MAAREVLKDINNEDRTLSDQVALELKSALDIKA